MNQNKEKNRPFSLENYIKENANVPNALTLLRLLLIPVYWVVFVNGDTTAALIIFAAGCFTDFLDGFIARKCNLITDFGKLADPVADKLMVLSVMFTQSYAGVLPKLPLYIILSKEALMVLGGIYMLKKGIVVYSNMVGKVGLVMFIAALLASFFHEFFISIGFQLDIILLWLSVANALIALVVYTRESILKLRS